MGTIGEDERDGGGPGRVDASRFAKGGRNKIEWSGPAPLSPRVTSRAPSGARVGLTPTAGRGQARVHLHERALHDDRAPLLSHYRLCARDAPVSGASVNAKSRTPLPRGAIIFARRSRKRAAPLNWGRLRTPCRLALAGGTYARDVYAARASVWRSRRTERAAIFPTPVAFFLVSLFRSCPSSLVPKP